MKLLLSLTLVMAAAKAEVTIDLAKAVFDEDLGQFCVMQKASFISKCHVHRVYRYRMSNIHTNIILNFSRRIKTKNFLCRILF